MVWQSIIQFRLQFNILKSILCFRSSISVNNRLKQVVAKVVPSSGSVKVKTAFNLVQVEVKETDSLLFQMWVVGWMCGWCGRIENKTIPTFN